MPPNDMPSNRSIVLKRFNKLKPTRLVKRNSSARNIVQLHSKLIYVAVNK